MFNFTKRVSQGLRYSLLRLVVVGVVIGLNQVSIAGDWQVLSDAALKATVNDKTWKARYWRVYWGADGQRLHWSQDTNRVNEASWQMESDGVTLCADSEARGHLCIQVEQRDGYLRAVELEGPLAGKKFSFKPLNGKVGF